MRFLRSKEVIKLFDEDFEKILVSDEFSFGKNKETDRKYFIGYKNDLKNWAIIHQVSKNAAVFLNKFEKTQYMSLVIKDKKVLEKLQATTL